MKKAIMVIAILMCFYINTQAGVIYEIEEVPEGLTREEYYNYENFRDNVTFFSYEEGYITTINGEQYYLNDYIQHPTYQKVYSFDFFNILRSKFDEFFQYEKTDNGFIVCEPPYRVGMQSYLWNGGGKKAYLYNDYYELTNTYEFDTFVFSVDFFNNNYYVQLLYGGNDKVTPTTFKWLKSTDFADWQECEKPQKIGNIVYENKVREYNPSNIGLLLYGTAKIEYNGVFGTTYSSKSYYSPNGIYSINIPEISSNALIWEDNDYLHCISGKRKITINKESLLSEINAIEQLPIIKLNDIILAFDQPPVVEDDRTLVPMRFLFEQMGADVNWDESTETATVTKDGEQISFQIDSPAAKIGGEVKLMDVPAKLVSDKTMVPLRFLAENLGYNVQWNEVTKLITITT